VFWDQLIVRIRFHQSDGAIVALPSDRSDGAFMLLRESFHRFNCTTSGGAEIAAPHEPDELPIYEHHADALVQKQRNSRERGKSSLAIFCRLTILCGKHGRPVCP
jgi:hypothetical protein